MNKNLVSSMLVYGVILIGLFLLTACQSSERVAVAAALPREAGIVYAMDPVDLKLFNAAETSPVYVPANVHSADRKFFTDTYLGSLSRDSFDYEQAAEAMAYRWQAMAEAYEKAGLLNDTISAGNADALRWQAIAREHENLGSLNK